MGLHLFQGVAVYSCYDDKCYFYIKQRLLVNRCLIMRVSLTLLILTAKLQFNNLPEMLYFMVDWRLLELKAKDIYFACDLGSNVCKFEIVFSSGKRFYRMNKEIVKFLVGKLNNFCCKKLNLKMYLYITKYVDHKI